MNIEQTEREIMDSVIKTGGIDEGGFLHNLFRKGFTHLKCLSELHANSLDANATFISYEVLRDLIKMIDNGNGMNEDNIKNMFSIYRANHTNDKSLGVSGFGAKPSLAILSNKKRVKIFTHKENSDYLCVVIPWDIMFQTSKYSGMIEITKMTDEEITAFQNERQHLETTTGTSIYFPYNRELENAIKVNFEDLPTMLPHPQDRLSIIYGKFHNTTVVYKHYEKPSKLFTLRPYDYFEGQDNDFYTGKRRDTIAVFKKENEIEKYRFIWKNSSDNSDYEIIRKGNGWAKNSCKLINNTVRWERIGEFTIDTGNRIDENYFNSTSNTMPRADAFIYQYDKQNGLTYRTENRAGQPIDDLSTKNFEYLCKPKVIRNSQVIGVMELPGMAISSARANGEAMHQMYDTRCEISYYPISNHTNELDLIVGVQENKNQLICNMPIQLSRLIKEIKQAKHNQIWSSFKEIVIANTIPEPIVVPPVAVIPVPELPPTNVVVVVDEPPANVGVVVEEPPANVGVVVEEPPANVVVVVEEHPANVIVVEEQPTNIVVVVEEPPAPSVEEPNIVPVSGTNHLTITVRTGLYLLDQWNNSQIDIDILEITIQEMIYKYQSRCSKDQVDDFLEIMDRNQKYKLLLNIIEKKYPENQENREMLFGSELYRLYSNSFTNVLV